MYPGARPKSSPPTFGRPPAMVAVALLFAMVWAFLQPAAPANAAVIPGAITSVSVREDSVSNSTAMTLDLIYAVPDTAEPGDTFTLQLPPELIAATRGFDLRDPDGNVVATAAVAANGLVTFTLSDYVLSHDNVGGTAFFQAFFTEFHQNGETIHLEFDADGTVFVDEVSVVRDPVNRDVPQKYGFWLDPTDQGVENPDRGLTWNIETPIGPLDTVNITDRLGAGQALDCDSIRVEETTQFDASGGVTNLEPLAATNYTLTSCDARGFVLDIAPVLAGQVVVVIYNAAITDDSLREYTNSADVVADGTIHHPGSTVVRTNEGGDGNGNGQTPEIDIEKWSTRDEYPAGDFDDAPGKPVKAGQPVPITFTITNTGTERLRDIRVTDTTQVGPAIKRLSCDFSALGGPATGTTWVGPFLPGAAFECTGTMPALPAGGTHSDTAAVNGTGFFSGTPVNDRDRWHSHAPKATPSIVTATSKQKAVPGAKLYDRVEITGLPAGYDGTGRATLYGPFVSRAAAECTPATKVKTVKFTPRNGDSRTPSVTVRRAGVYTWVASTSATKAAEAATHRCGMASETTLIKKAPYIPPTVPTGFAGTYLAKGLSAKGSTASLRVPGLGVSGPVSGVGVSNGSMDLPANVANLGWLNKSARIDDAIGTTVVAGHVSDYHDRPGAMWNLSKVRKGQVVAYTAGDGKVYRFKVTEIKEYDRNTSLPKSVFATGGAHRLVLITCSDKVNTPGGHFHYTKNLVVTAKPIK